MYSVYIRYSPSFNKIYIGYSSDLESRIETHNVLSTKGYTIRDRPWMLVFSEDYNTKSEAIKREGKLKSDARKLSFGASPAFILEIVKLRNS
jgi:putative endonuclease